MSAWMATAFLEAGAEMLEPCATALAKTVDVLDVQKNKATAREFQVDRCFRVGLWAGENEVNLSGEKILRKRKRHEQTNGRPAHNGCAGLPVVDAFLLLSTVDAETNFAFEEGAIWTMFAFAGPDHANGFLVLGHL